MKKFGLVFSAIIASMLLIFSACADGDPEEATQKEMLNYGTFYGNFSADEDRSVLTMNEDYTYTLYIRDYDRGSGMKTHAGTWSHAFTYDYKYCQNISGLELLNKTRSSTLGIYLLSDCTLLKGTNSSVYFVYEKSTGAGGLLQTSQKVDEDFLKDHRKAAYGAGKYMQKVELSLIPFEADTDK